MTIATTISIMGGASLAAMAGAKIATECGMANIAQYINLFAGCSVGITAITGCIELIRLIATI